eukprot:6789-Eustigmatos_ZCMA.PRE.1
MTVRPPMASPAESRGRGYVDTLVRRTHTHVYTHEHTGIYLTELQLYMHANRHALYMKGCSAHDTMGALYTRTPPTHALAHGHAKITDIESSMVVCSQEHCCGMKGLGGATVEVLCAPTQ